MLLTADPQLQVGVSITKVLVVVHDDGADAVPACKDAGEKKAWGDFSQVCWSWTCKAAKICIEHFQEE